MRACALAILLAAMLSGPVRAWEFSATPLCTLTRIDGVARIEITYDPAVGTYSLHLADIGAALVRPTVFIIRFEGPRGLTISTDRHVVENGQLTVRDRGFGNVLNGLQHNLRAVALVGTRSYAFDLATAAPAVEAFRACEVPPAV